MGLSGRENDGQFAQVRSLLRGRRAHVVHLTHNDLDAVGADAIHRMQYDEVLTLFSSVGKFPHYLNVIAGEAGNGDCLSISDLGCPQSVLPALEVVKSRGWRVEWRDHHRWQDEELALVSGIVDILHVDTSICACGICAADLRPGDPRAQEVARVVCDYDLWKNEDPQAAVLGQVLQRKRNRDHVRDCLVNGVFSDPVIEREYREIREDLRNAVRRSIRRRTLRENRYSIIFAPLHAYPSETAAEIRRQFNSDIEVLVSPQGRFSLRSVPPISHLIARQFGGGGHQHAAGGTFEFSFLDRAVFWITGKSRHFEKLVQVAETI